ncbi:MAG: GTPase, partial [Chlamydiales bacterium]
MKENFYHDRTTTKHLNLMKGGKPTRNSKGEIVKDAAFQKSTCKPISKIDRNRKWFCNTKTITQNELDNFRNQVSSKKVYQVLLSQGKLPFSLLKPTEQKKKHTNDYSKIFGKSAQRKRPKLEYKNVEELLSMKSKVEIVEKQTSEEKESVEYVKGQSKRIWNELYKVIDSSDVIIHVLDARDPMGTKCAAVSKYLEEAKHKHLIYVLNKVDLVPTSVTAAWLRILSKERPTIAFHSSALNNFYGKNTLTNLLRQYASLHKKPEISVGFIGFPNVGKSSIINILRNKKVCSVAPVPGQTRVWQYIALCGKIYLIDCPGIVPYTNEKDAVLRGAVRIENVEDPELYVEEILKKA